LLDQIFLTVMTSLRMLLSQELAKEGISQRKISRLLCVSQPAVNKYLKEDKARILEKLNEMGFSREELETLVESAKSYLAREKIVDANWILAMETLRLLAEGRACNYHRELTPAIPENCDLCSRIYQSLTLSDPTIRNVKRALEIFLEHDSSIELLPEVGSNIAEAKPGAIHPSEVVAIPGRITKSLGKPHPGGNPTYGASRHLAKILLNILSFYPEIRGAVVVKYSETYKNKAQSLGETIIVSRGKLERNDIVADIVEALKKHGGPPPDFIIDEGGLGIEPVIYVFGRDSVDAVKKALQLTA